MKTWHITVHEDTLKDMSYEDIHRLKALMINHFGAEGHNDLMQAIDAELAQEPK